MATGKYDGSIRILIENDAEELLDNLKEVNTTAGKLESAFKKVGAAVAGAFAVDKIVDFAKESVGLASDLQEVQNVVDVTFGDSTSTINEFARSAASAYGMSELAAKQYTGTIGAMLKSMGLSDDAVLDMSQDLTGLAGDFASFYNLDHEEAFNKIRAGISGETEPLKQLGINMSVANLEAFALAQGIETSYDAMSSAEQTALRYSYLMSVTADAQGDFARTSDSLANQQRILELNMQNVSATVGKSLLPTVNAAASAINGLLSGSITPEEFGTQLTGILTSGLQMVTQQLPAFMEAGTSMLGGIIQGIGAALPALLPATTDILLTIVDGLIDNIPMLIDGALALIVGLADGLLQSLPVLIERIPEIVLSIMTALTEGQANIMEAGVELLSALVKDLPAIIRAVVKAVPELIKSLVKSLVNNVKTFAEVGKQFITGIWDGVSSMAKWLGEKISGVFTNIVDGVRSTFSNLVTNIKELFHDVVKFLSTGFTNAWKNTWNGVIGFLEGAVNLIIKGLNWLISKMNLIQFDVPEWVPGIGGNTVGVNIPLLADVKIPRLATGAVIPPNREFMAVLGDQKSGTNIEAPEALIRKIVREESGGNTELLSEILDAIRAGRVMKVDKRILAQVTAEGINDMTKQTGKPVLLY